MTQTDTPMTQTDTQEGMMRNLVIGLMVALFGLSGCSVILPWDDFEDRMTYMKESNPSGCAYVKGSGTPPASRVDGAIVGAWGEGTNVKDCAEVLKGLP